MPDSKPERRNDTRTRQRIEEIREELLRTLKILQIAVWVVGLSNVGAYALTFNLSGDRTEDINRQRAVSLRSSCQDQNQRNENTKARLIYLSSIDKRKDAQERLDATLSLIDALAPVRECEDLVKERVKP